MVKLCVFEGTLAYLSLGVILRFVLWLFGYECRQVFLVESVGQARGEAVKTVLSENQTIGNF